MALGTLAFFGALAVGVGARAGAQVDAVRRLSDRAEQAMVAQGHVVEALAMLRKPVEERTPIEDVQIQDETGRISLNTASLEVLLGLLASAGADEAHAEEIAHAIMDWRDADSDPQPKGTEAGAKNAPFESAEELLLVRGMEAALWTALRDRVTVHGDGNVNLHSASAGVLQSLGVSEGLARAIVGYTHGGDGVRGTEDDRSFTSVGAFPSELAGATRLTPEQQREASTLAGSGQVTTEVTLLLVRAQGRVMGRAGVREVRCVVDGEGSILEWREQ